MSRNIKIHWINTASWLDELKEHLPYEFTEVDPDVIIGWSVIQMPKVFQAIQRYPNAKLVNYNWDVYSWVWDRPRPGEYNYTKYGELLQRSDEVWVPSKAEQERTKKWFDINAHIIPTFIPLFESETKDDNYVLNPLRKLPDEHDGWFEQVCEEFNIPYISNGEHDYDYEEYKKIIANCSFLCSPYKETSTGGLDLMKGSYLGKKSLVYSGSGAKDYLGDCAEYFDTYEELKEKLNKMWEERPSVSCEKDFSIDEMCGMIRNRLEVIL